MVDVLWFCFEPIQTGLPPTKTPQDRNLSVQYRKYQSKGRPKTHSHLRHMHACCVYQVWVTFSWMIIFIASVSVVLWAEWSILHAQACLCENGFATWLWCDLIAPFRPLDAFLVRFLLHRSKEQNTCWGGASTSQRHHLRVGLWAGNAKIGVVPVAHGGKSTRSLLGATSEIGRLPPGHVAPGFLLLVFCSPRMHSRRVPVLARCLGVRSE